MCQFVVYMTLIIGIDTYKINKFKGVGSRPREITTVDMLPKNEDVKNHREVANGVWVANSEDHLI